MPISKLVAETAIKALVNGGVTKFSDLNEFNPHLTEKHFHKDTALGAAQSQGHPQGYFKRLNQVQIVEFADLSGNRLTKGAKLKAAQDAGLPSLAGFLTRNPKTPIPAFAKAAAEQNDWSKIAWAVINSGDLTLRESTVNPALNFIAVAPIPEGFYGRTIDRDGEKRTNVNNAVVVIDATVQANPQLVTMFPADSHYVEARPLLI